MSLFFLFIKLFTEYLNRCNTKSPFVPLLQRGKDGTKGGKNPSPVSFYESETPIPRKRTLRQVQGERNEKGSSLRERVAEGKQNPSLISLYERETSIPRTGRLRGAPAPLYKIPSPNKYIPGLNEYPVWRGQGEVSTNGFSFT
jgi:hypothetical protein